MTRLGDCLDEVTQGVGPSWGTYRVLGATRDGLAPAKEPVGKVPERYKPVNPGTIFYNPMRILLGSIALLDEGQEPGITSPDYVVFRPRPGVVHTRWFYYWLRSDDGAGFIRTLARGAVRERLLFRRLAAAAINLPFFEQQERFAECALDVERARAAAEAQRGPIEGLGDAWRREALGGVTPLAAGPPRVPAPAGWRWRRLKDVARLESGHTPSRYYPEYWGGTIPWIALPDIRALDGKVAHQTAECTNELGIANSAARVLPPETVVLSRTASVGFVTIMGREMATSQDFVNWVCGPELEPRFLLHLLLAARTYFRSLASGAVHKTVYMPAVESLQVCLPEVNRQRALAAWLDDRLREQEHLVAANRAACAAVEALPAALLRRAFRGDL